MASEAVKKQNRQIIFGAILFVLVSVIVFFFIQNQTLSNTNEQRERELNAAVLQLDSLSTELDKQIATIADLGGEIDTLLALKSQLESEKRTYWIWIREGKKILLN